MYQTILVPVDGSKRAEAIFTHVEKLARMNDASTIFLRVEEEPILLGRDEIIETTTYQEGYNARVNRATAYLDDLKSVFRKKGIHAVTRLAYGPVVKAILTVATETGADLIALATHGLGGLARVSYGSVAAGVLQAADIPILLIRSGSGPTGESD
jgi:nucleotide-binding universal stress UspA family protein